MRWYEGRLAAFDVESTGIDAETDRIVTATICAVGGGEDSTMLSWLADPGVEIPAAAAEVHGVTTERARAAGRPAPEVVEEIVSRLAALAAGGAPVVAFNARYDLTMLDREARRHGVAPLADRVAEGALFVVDPLVIDKQLDRYRKGKRTLTAVCAHYGVELSEDDAHDAAADAIAAARVAWKVAKKFPEVGEAALADLHNLQVQWAAEQAESLEQWFRSQGRDERCERAWPIVPLPLEAGQRG